MKEQILKLRDENKTYTEIKNILGCSKGTISYHCGKDQKEKSKQRLKNNRKGIYSTKKEKICLNCEKSLIQKRNKYCDNICYKEHKFKGTLIKFYKGNILWNSTLRKILIHLFGNICSKCNQSNNWNGIDLTLEVDHINGDSDNCNPDNLRLLCPNCHSQTETSNGRNTKKQTRRNRYLRKYKK